MKRREIYSEIRTIAPCFIRLDGRSFRSVAGVIGLEKPFDERFSTAMETVSSLLLRESGLSADFAYTFSDEINLFFTKLPFYGRVEKLDSVAASYTASALTQALTFPSPISFDARVVPVDGETAVEYLIWRQKEAWRNHNNAYCQWALGEDGHPASQVQELLHGMNTAAMHELMHSRGINLAETPGWQRRGLVVYRTSEEMPGYNPKEDEAVVTQRTRIVSDRNPPLFNSEEGRVYLSSLISGAKQGN